MDVGEPSLAPQGEHRVAVPAEGRKGDHGAVFSALGILLGEATGAQADGAELSRGAVRVMVAELSRADVTWTVVAEGFRVGETLFGDPDSLGGAARRLHRSGIRAISFIVGFGESEWETLVSWLRDELPGDDAFTRWLDLKLPHVTIDAVFEPRDGRERLVEARRKLERARAATVAVLKTANATSVVVDGDEVKTAYDRAWELPGSFDGFDVDQVDVVIAELAAGILLGTEEGFGPDVAARLEAALSRAMRFDDPLDPGRPFELWAHLDAWCQRNASADSASALARQMRATCPGDVVAARLRRLVVAATHPHADRAFVLRDAVVRGVTVVLEQIDAPEVVLEVCERLDVGCLPPLAGALETFLRSASKTHAGILANRVVSARAQLGVALVEALHDAGGSDAVARVERALANPVFEVKLAAIARLGEPLGERARHELVSLLESPDAGVRKRTLEAVEAVPLVAAGPLVVRRIQSEAFTELPVEERRLALSVVHALKPSRAEAIAIEILGRRRLLAENEYEETRALCAELLSRSSAPEAAQALEEVVKQKWGTSQTVRDAAEAALLLVRERLPKRPTMRPGS